MPAIPPKSTAVVADAPLTGPQYKTRLPNTQAALRAANAWVAAGADPTVKNSYKFIHHTVDQSGNVGPAVAALCSAGIAVLNGARGGTTIPNADKQGVWRHLAQHLRDFNKSVEGYQPPALQAAAPPGQDRIAFAGNIAAEGRRIRGSVQLAGQRTWRGGEWVEVDPAALVAADATDTFATLNHDASKVLARMKNQTLTLSRTDQGIEYQTAELPNTTDANDALELARGGYFGGSSFAIDGLRSAFSTEEDGTRVRRITSIKRLIDVAPVYDPAFENSSAAAFSKENEMPEEQEQAGEEFQNATPPAPAAPAAPTIQAVPQPERNVWEEFAKDMPIEELRQRMDSIWTETKGDMHDVKLEQYAAFAGEIKRRKVQQAENRAKLDAAKAAHDLLVGKKLAAPEAGLFSSDEYHEAFTKYLRTGDPISMEQFAQAVAGDGTQGGYTVPDGFLNRIVEAMAAYGGIQGIAENITTSDGQDLRWPSNDDTSNSAAIATEGSAVASGGADLVFGSITLGAYSYDSTGTGNVPLLVSKELIQDAAFDIEAFISRKLGERLGRKMAADFATGNGSSKPKGLLAKSADTMSATSMFAALVEHHFQVDAAYRAAGCRWVMSDSTLTKVYNSVDANGRPLYIATNDSSGATAPTGMLLGFPVTLDQGAGDLVAFGNIRQGFIIRHVRGVQIDVDPYTNIKSRQIAYHGWARADSNVQDSSAYSVSDYSGVSADS